MNGIQDCQKSESVLNANQHTGIGNGKTREIQLIKFGKAIIDEEDYDYISQWKWYLLKRDRNFYAVRNIVINGKHSILSMHRGILRLSHGDGKVVDHKDRNGLNNCKVNLRLCDFFLNGYNCRTYKTNTSGYRGVSFQKANNKWKSYINYNGKLIYCGLYFSALEAAIAYNESAKKYYGNNAVLNIIEKQEE